MGLGSCGVSLATIIWTAEPDMDMREIRMATGWWLAGWAWTWPNPHEVLDALDFVGFDTDATLSVGTPL